MRYLLDTNIISDLLRNPRGIVAQRINRVGESKVCTSIIVAAELRYGAAKKGSPQLSTALDAILKALDILAFETPADKEYARIRARLEKSGRLIGANDLLIATQAIALGFTLVSDNEREFSRVQDLQHENWLR
ncbi:MAG TPA: type II toxin-antitoxin system VapC family toxin [Dongiaceae bacterium]|nr:type II toxin-antitoxin system VapC family toxin [Dongiaceae bacterium]